MKRIILILFIVFNVQIVAAEVKLKTKNNFQNPVFQQKQQSGQQSGQQNKPFGSGKFNRGQAANNWLAAKFAPNDSGPRSAINTAIKSATDKNNLVNSLYRNPILRMTESEAKTFVDTLESA